METHPDSASTESLGVPRARHTGAVPDDADEPDVEVSSDDMSLSRAPTVPFGPLSLSVGGKCQALACVKSAHRGQKHLLVHSAGTVLDSPPRQKRGQHCKRFLDSCIVNDKSVWNLAKIKLAEPGEELNAC